MLFKPIAHAWTGHHKITGVVDGLIRRKKKAKHRSAQENQAHLIKIPDIVHLTRHPVWLFFHAKIAVLCGECSDFGLAARAIQRFPVQNKVKTAIIPEFLLESESRAHKGCVSSDLLARVPLKAL